MSREYYIPKNLVRYVTLHNWLLQSLAFVKASSDYTSTIRPRSIRTKPIGNPLCNQATLHLVPTSLPIPASPRVTDSPVMRPRTAGPVMVSTRNDPSSEEAPPSEDLELSVQTLPEPMPRASPQSSASSSIQSPRTSVPHQFFPLVKAIELLCAEKRTERPLRSNVALKILEVDKRVYNLAGVPKFKQYAELAKQQAIVELGGSEGEAWISLRPEWRGLVL